MISSVNWRSGGIRNVDAMMRMSITDGDKLASDPARLHCAYTASAASM